MMSASEPTIRTFRLLSSNPKHLDVLAYFYQIKSDNTLVRHDKLCEKFQGSKSLGTYYAKKLCDTELICKEKSKITGLINGYKISGKGIKFFELYLKLVLGIEAEK